jgi:hypothetical protein
MRVKRLRRLGLLLIAQGRYLQLHIELVRGLIPWEYVILLHLDGFCEFWHLIVMEVSGPAWEIAGRALLILMLRGSVTPVQAVKAKEGQLLFVNQVLTSHVVITGRVGQKYVRMA